MCDLLKEKKVKQRRQPKNDVKNERAGKLSQHDLPVPHRSRHQWLDCAELKLLGEKSHSNERKDQDKGEPEKNGIKKRLLHRVLQLSLIHERNLEIEIHARDEQEENEN